MTTLLPTSCPQCGSHAVSWSPKRVWCTMCSFQTAAKHGENAPNTIARWNHAILDGIGYTDLIQENNERQERARREKAGNFVTTHLS